MSSLTNHSVLGKAANSQSRSRSRPCLPFAVLSLALIFLGGCSNAGYYAQSVNGHLQLMGKAEPVQQWLADPQLDAKTRERLERSQQLREFASSELGLPRNKSYRSYADLKRPYVVWNVVAAEEFSVEPQRWCFLVVGCLSYRGYFDKADAEEYAKALRDKGMDVAVSGSQAYSTLGWFSDPLLSTILNQSEARLAEVMFHELAHQQLYIEDDTAFNEAFATAVARYGVQRWYQSRGDEKGQEIYRIDLQRRRDFNRLMLETRGELNALYAQPLETEAMREAKLTVFNRMQEKYRHLKETWGGYSGYDIWMGQALNNAHLALVATYQELVPDFMALIEQYDGNMQAFYAEAERIGALSPSERLVALQSSAGF